MDRLASLVAEELAEPVDPRVSAMAAAIAALHPGAARAILFYGSCLRERQLDGLMLDFYLIVSDYRAVYGKGWMAGANRLIPPNVFPFQHDGLAAKYAVLSEADFLRLNGPESLSVSVWARFAQPSRLVWQADDAAREPAAAAVARAAPTLLGQARPLFAGTDLLDLWRLAFSLTYSAELRSELAECLGPLLGRLPAKQRQALTLTELEGLTQASAAARLGLSTSGMKSRVQRGRAQLRQLLDACCEIDLESRGDITNYQSRRGPCDCRTGNCRADTPAMPER